MKKFEELTEVEKALRSLIYAVESRVDINPEHVDTWLNTTLGEAKEVANKIGIPLVK